MGGKRPDQHNIDPGEAGSTDYKFRRQDQGIKDQEKQEYMMSRKDATEGHIPKSGENPVLRELRERKDAALEQEAGDAGDGGDERAD